MGHDDTNPFPYDPSKPLHPLFNLPPAARLNQHRREVEYRERQPFEKEWDAVVCRVKVREFTSRNHLADAYRKGWQWAARITALMLKQGGFTRGELKALMSKKASQYDPSLIASRTAYTGRRRPLTRERFEEVFTAHGLTFDSVVLALRAHAWKSPKELCCEFHQAYTWGRSLKTLLIRQRVMTVGDWTTCFKTSSNNRAESTT